MSQRRQWIIDRRLQGRFIIVLVLIGAVNCIFYLFTLNYLLNEMHSIYEGVLGQGASGELRGSASVAYMTIQRGLFMKAALSGLVIQALLIALLGVYFSNRISGPIYRLNKALRDMSQGDGASAIVLRKHDFMTEIIDNFNATVVFQNNRQRDILDKLQALKGKATAGQAAEIEAVIVLVKGLAKESDQVSATK